MFPLGGVLFPHMSLPLRVFEMRYLELVRTCLDTTNEFGVVLIERGREVGGGDERYDVGCVAEIVSHRERNIGQWHLETLGTRRVRVARWLPDDPYPRAELEDWPDPPPSDDAAGMVEVTAAVLRRVLAMAAELGASVPAATTELVDDPVMASYELSIMAPLPALDKLALLGSVTVEARLTLLEERLRDVQDLLAVRLAEG